MAARKRDQPSDPVEVPVVEEAEEAEPDESVESSPPAAESTNADADQPSDPVDLAVLAPLVVVKNAKGDVVNLRAGDVIPEGTQRESIDHLLSLGFVK